MKIDFWLVLGFVAQFFFFMRFFVQWVVSEKKGKSVIPNTFWYLSILGGALLLVYSVYRRDPVFILGQSMGLIIYLRNIVLINKEKADAP